MKDILEIGFQQSTKRGNIVACHPIEKDLSHRDST